MTPAERFRQMKRHRRLMWIRARWALVALALLGIVACFAALTWTISNAKTQLQDPMQWGRK